MHALPAQRPDRVRRLALLPATLLVGACGPAPTFDDTLSTVRSWTATATLAAAHERAGQLSHRLAAQLHARADDARREGTQTLGALAQSPDERRRAQAALDSLDAAMQGLGAQPVAR